MNATETSIAGPARRRAPWRLTVALLLATAIVIALVAVAALAAFASPLTVLPGVSVTIDGEPLWRAGEAVALTPLQSAGVAAGLVVAIVLVLVVVPLTLLAAAAAVAVAVLLAVGVPLLVAALVVAVVASPLLLVGWLVWRAARPRLA